MSIFWCDVITAKLRLIPALYRNGSYLRQKSG